MHHDANHRHAAGCGQPQVTRHLQGARQRGIVAAGQVPAIRDGQRRHGCAEDLTGRSARGGEGIHDDDLRIAKHGFHQAQPAGRQTDRLHLRRQALALQGFHHPPADAVIPQDGVPQTDEERGWHVHCPVCWFDRLSGG